MPPRAEQIGTRREFTDKYLLTNPLGKGLFKLYYKISLPMAELITEHPNLKPVVRVGLFPKVDMSGLAVNAALAKKTAPAGLLALISVALTI
jgi:hypothetical protein